MFSAEVDGCSGCSGLAGGVVVADVEEIGVVAGWGICPEEDVVMTGSWGSSETILSAAELHASDSPCKE